MSMITKQVERLREQAELLRGKHYITTYLDEAADTIEQLAAKVRKENKTEEAIALERYEDLCIFFHNDKDVLNNRKEFIDWLERMKWHVKMADELFRENEAYQKAFEDIRAELTNNHRASERRYWTYYDLMELLDKHNPDKERRGNDFRRMGTKEH